MTYWVALEYVGSILTGNVIIGSGENVVVLHPNSARAAADQLLDAAKRAEDAVWFEPLTVS